MIIQLVCILQCWRTTLKPDWYAHTYTVVCSSCHDNLPCGNLKLLLLFVCLFLCCFVLFFVQRTARNCSKVPATRAAQFSVLARPIKFLITGVVISDPVVDANTHSYHICYITVRMLTTDTRF